MHLVFIQNLLPLIKTEEMIVISSCAYSKGMNSDSNEPLVIEEKQICDVGLESSPLGLYRYQVCKVNPIWPGGGASEAPPPGHFSR